MPDLIVAREATTPVASRFLVVLAGVAGFLLVGVAALNVIADPHSEFGTRLLPALVPPYRSMKVTMYENFTAIPRTVILGSSRMAAFPPDALDAAGIGPSFNFAMPAGSIEDVLAVQRYVIARNRALRTVIVGVDYDRFDAAFPTHWPERQGTPLADALNETPSLMRRVCLIASSLRPGYVRDVLRTFLLLVRGLPPPDRTISSSGQMHYLSIERQIARGGFSFRRAMLEDPEVAHAAREYLRVYSTLASPDPGKVAVFALAVEEAVARGLEVRLVILPIHPELLGRLKATAFPSHRDTLLVSLKQLCRHRGVHLHDFTELESIAGDPDFFVDTTHPILENYSKVVGAMMRGERDLCARKP